MMVNSAADNEFIKKLTRTIEDNLENADFGVSELAKTMGMSRSSLHSKTRSAVNTSASRFIRQVRLEKALYLLRHSSLLVSEIAYKVGFGSVSYFNRCFHDLYGYPPGEAKHRFSREDGASSFRSVNPGILRRRRLRTVLVSVSIVLVAVIGLLVLSKVVPRVKDDFGKSIAVMPLQDFSEEKGNRHLINRLESQIIEKFYRIKNLSVVPYSAVDVYRDSKKSNAEIACELNVTYLLRGNVTVIMNKMSINLELIEAAREKLLNTYSSIISIDDPTSIFATQEKIALDIADELGIALTIEDEIQITKLPSENLSALNDFNKAQAYLDAGDIEKAKYLLTGCIAMDSAFVDAYVLMGRIYIEMLYDRHMGFPRANPYLDSGIFYADRALQFDNRHPQARYLKYSYFLKKGMSEEARSMEPISANVIKNYLYYQERFSDYHLMDSFYEAINAYLKYERTKPKDQLIPPDILHKIRECYDYTGFPEQARKYAQLRLDQTRDSLWYYKEMAWIENKQENFQKSLDLVQRGSRLDSTYYLYLTMVIKFYLKDYQGAYEYLRKEEEIAPFDQADYGAGLVYLMNGRPLEADYHIKGSIERYHDYLSSGIADSKKTRYYFLLSSLYSQTEDRANAFKYLQLFNTREIINKDYLLDLKLLPYFDNIREDPEFKSIFTEVEAKYQREHNRVKELLLREGII